MKKMVVTYLRKHKEKRIKEQITKLIEKESFEDVGNVRPAKIEKIAIVTSYVAAHAGGMTSILRIGTALEKNGFSVTYIALSGQSKKELTENAGINLKNYRGKMETKEALEENYDVVIATDWKSVYTVTQMDGYKMYFVQDYEPYFCEDGERYILAKKTYEVGLHMISLGKWNKHEIERNVDCDTKISYVDFPYERSEYHMVERDYESYKNKKEFEFVVYLKQAGRRLPTIIPLMLEKVKKRFEENQMKLNISFYGGIEDIPEELGKNLGKLSKAELMELYAKADFGMVSSMTNISLVPYEMLATGLPVVEFKDGTFPYFFDKEAAILTSFSADDLYTKMKECIQNPEKLEQMHKNAMQCMENLSWDATGQQFADIIKSLID